MLAGRSRRSLLLRATSLLVKALLASAFALQLGPKAPVPGHVPSADRKNPSNTL
jgi:hypothetical protein